MSGTDTKNNPAILVVGHGSRDVEAIEEFNKMVAKLKVLNPDRKCEVGFLEFATPLIEDGVEALIAQGAKDITAIPGMLMAAGHAKNDIPSELNTLQRKYAELNIRYGVELGVNPRMLRAAAARIEEAESHFGEHYEREHTLLVVVGRGASDADANSNISKICRMLEEGMGFGWAITCYSGVTSPLVADALETSYGLGFKRVIIFPYFLFTGRLIKKIYQAADDFQEQHPELEVVKAGYLNDHPLVLETIMQRLHETENGVGNMNCQMCQYREQILGSEDKVGQAQQGHHHHVRGAGTDHDHNAHSHDHDHDHDHEHKHD